MPMPTPNHPPAHPNPAPSDRLLAEHDRLRRQLGQATGQAVGGPASKKDE